MKNLLLALLLLPATVFGQKTERDQRRINEQIEFYKYPTNEKTGRICYEKQIDVPQTNKATLYRRAMQFVALQNYGRTENIKCKNGSTINIQLFDEKPLIADSIDGKIVGNGFMPWNHNIGGMQRYYIVFKYKLSVKDDSYKYQFTDFKMLEFMSAPKEKGRTGGYISSFGYGGFATGSTTRTHSDAAIFQEDLEMFILRGIYRNDNSGDAKFATQRRRIISDLKQIMVGEL